MPIYQLDLPKHVHRSMIEGPNNHSPGSGETWGLNQRVHVPCRVGNIINCAQVSKKAMGSHDHLYLYNCIYIHSHSFENIRESWLDGFQPIFFVIFTIHHPEMEFAVHLVLHGWDESCGPKVAPGSLP